MLLTPKNRVPIDHPEYEYPSSKNPYWTKNRQYEGMVFSDNETEKHRSTWREHFRDCSQSHPPQQRELHVEIGCNAGHVISKWAKNCPQRAYIGIDWKFKSIFRAAEKAASQQVDNLLLFRAHAERMEYMFGPQEIDHLYLFFPDPWPRKSQWKNRFITPERLRTLASLLKPSGVFHIKTDHQEYFESMLKSIADVSPLWKVSNLTRDLHESHPSPHLLDLPEVTLFEKLFIKDQIPIRSMKLMLQ